MIRKIAPRMLEWAKSDMANVIVMKGAGEKAFCAGGDVAQLAKWNKEGASGQGQSRNYFAQEYKLDHLIATFNKPYIAFMDGITMGGGVGLSVHAPFRIATERTVFAMPETTIGFFPDVGASFFLPRMPGFIGTYLALTSSRLTGANVFYSGIATHYLHSTSLPQLESRLAELRFADHDDLPTRLATINATIEEFVTGLPHDEPILLRDQLRLAIDRCFGHDTVDAILRALEHEVEHGPMTGWARETLETLHKRSPTSVHVALRQMRIGAKWNIRDTFVREHAIASKFMAGHDFTEGVSALLIEKRPAKWSPAASLEDIAPEDSAKLTNDFFLVPKDQRQALRLLTDANYDEYPYAFGVPTEKQVEDKVVRGTMSREQIVDEFVRERGLKQGVREVVEEILARKTKVKKTAAGSEMVAVWKY
jgi:3-hydroxyisobutyryl-CoA hydrolase